MSRVIPLVAALIAVPLAGCGPRAKTDPTGTRPTVPPVPPIEIKMPGAPVVPDPEAGNKALAKKRLATMGEAFHNHHDKNKSFPAGIAGPGGRVGLSWRVQLLPQLGQDELYKQFKLNEPWDSKHNKTLIEKMPEVYASPGKSAPAGQTYLRSLVGRYAFLRPATGDESAGQPVAGRRVSRDFLDGTSHTLIVAETPNPVVWTKPDDLQYDGDPWDNKAEPATVPQFGGVFADGFHGLMADARPLFFPKELVNDALLRRIITPDGGELTGLDEIWNANKR